MLEKIRAVYAALNDICKMQLICNDLIFLEKWSEVDSVIMRINALLDYIYTINCQIDYIEILKKVDEQFNDKLLSYKISCLVDRLVHLQKNNFHFMKIAHHYDFNIQPDFFVYRDAVCALFREISLLQNKEVYYEPH
ncbi:hypothetical protein ACK3Z8_03730 [Aeromonas caviae]|nr:MULTISPECIES: hypothetical protein [Aeromonas]